MNEDHSMPGSLAASPLVKVRFVLPVEDRRQGVEAENLWAESLGGGQFRIDSIPFYIYGVSFGDVVSVEEEADRLVFRAVVKRSGHSTYRVLVTDERGFESDGFKLLWSQLEQLGCSHEVAKRRWITIDVADSADVRAAYKIFEAGEKAGTWTFEEAHCGHSV